MGAVWLVANNTAHHRGGPPTPHCHEFLTLTGIPRQTQVTTGQVNSVYIVSSPYPPGAPTCAARCELHTP